MGLDVPELDDHPYEALLERARERLPIHADTWTDHNAHDPGITILELVAWLAETYTYQLDRVTPAHRQKHLRLLGIRPRPPVPASTRLQVGDQRHHGRVIETGEQLVVDDPDGFTGVFETTKPVTLTAARIERVLTHHPDGLEDHTTANETYGMSFLAFGERASRDSQLYLGLDRDPFSASVDIIDVTVEFDDEELPPVPTTGDGGPFEPSVELAWEYCTDYANWRRDDAWTPFSIRRDQTNNLYESGTIALERGPDWPEDPSGVLGFDNDRSTRQPCTESDRPRSEPDVSVWIRCTVERSGYEIPPLLNTVRLDVVPAKHGVTVDHEALTRLDDAIDPPRTPGRTYSFAHAPVLAATITVDGERWHEVSDFDASGPEDRHFVLDKPRGRITFGDGSNGKRVPPETTVVAERYICGGGADGNVPRTATCAFRAETLADVPVSLLAPATGGADAESIQEAIGRARVDRERIHRAVSLADYRRIAVQTPDVRIERVAAVSTTTDDAHVLGATDEVRIVIVPYSPLERPRPSKGMLDAVRRHLEGGRLLTDRVSVERPTYVEIGVETTISVARGYAESGRIAATTTALDAFLDPLAGADGNGWPFGHTVYKSELYGLIARLEGIEAVHDVIISSGPNGSRDDKGNVHIDDGALVYPGEHGIQVQPAGDRGGS